jgi:hypothetical protein
MQNYITCKVSGDHFIMTAIVNQNKKFQETVLKAAAEVFQDFSEKRGFTREEYFTCEDGKYRTTISIHVIFKKDSNELYNIARRIFKSYNIAVVGKESVTCHITMDLVYFEGFVCESQELKHRIMDACQACMNNIQFSEKVSTGRKMVVGKSIQKSELDYSMIRMKFFLHGLNLNLKDERVILHQKKQKMDEAEIS